MEKKHAVTARCLHVCSALLLLLFAKSAYGGGMYQRTKDGKALIWNDNPVWSEEAIWSGGRDPNGYAIGQGTLTWYRVERKFLTGSNIPPAKGGTVVRRYSGKMVRGKLDGPVVSVDAKRNTIYATFVNGSRIGSWSAGPAPALTPGQRRNERSPGGAVAEAPAQGAAPTPVQRRNESVHRDTVVEAPAEGPAAVPDQRRNERVRGDTVVEAPTQSRAPLEVETAPSSAQMAVALAASPRAPIPPALSLAPPSSTTLDPIVKNRMIADFKEETQSVLLRVGDATGNFHEIDRLESVQKLPAPVSESVGSLVERARDFRAKVGYETALHEYRAETETVDALSVVDQITRNIAANDASAANSKLSDFLKSNPEPTAENEKVLWRYLTSVGLLCSRSERDADIHSQRAQSLASAGKTSEAIREYQEAYRIFPNPATAEKIRQLQDNSLGL